MIKTKDLKEILKENNIDFRSYWDKKRLLDLVEKHGLLPEEATVLPKKERRKDPKFDRLKTIMHNPKKVSLEDVETGEIKTFPSIYKTARFLDSCPQTIVYWDCKVEKINIRLTSNNFIMTNTNIIEFYEINLSFYFTYIK